MTGQTTLRDRLTKANKRRVLEGLLRRAMARHQDGLLGDKELTAITMGTAATLDDEELGPLWKP